MTTPRARADVELLEKLVCGRLPAAEAERLAVEYADDSRVSELAEAVANSGDTLVDSLRNHQTIADPTSDELVRRLVQRLRGVAAPAGTESRTSAPTPDKFTGQPPMPECLEYFQIGKILGEGGMGTVYLADDTRLQRRVALKTLKRELAVGPGARDRFLHEARSAARLEHDHIVPIYYVGEADGVPFLAMPLLQGEPLDARLRRRAPLPLPEAMRIARQIADGLAAAHERGLIHRDIKPGNVWLESHPAGRVKILDFGLVRSQNAETNLTASGAILGTPAYMAPEQARGTPVDHRADLFSLGCVLYEMLTGRRPFTGPDPMAVLLSVTVDAPKAPREVNPHCPPDLSRLTMRLLAKRPDERPSSAGEVVEALAKMERAADATEELAQPAKTAPKTMPQNRRLLPLAAVGLMLAFIGVGVLFGGTIYRIATNKGELVIEVDDKDVEIKIVQNGLVVQDKTAKREFTLTAGEGEIQVLDSDGLALATKKFELTRNGKTRVKVTPGELTDARRTPDRKAAEYVLSIGGTVKVNDGEQAIETVADLPRERFRLRCVEVRENRRISDAGMAAFSGCKDLKEIDLWYAPVGDAGLAHLGNCRKLSVLKLADIKLSDRGLAEFEGCLALTYLDLGGTRASDAGLAHFERCKEIAILGLNGTKVSDAGLAVLKDCKKLTFLSLNGTQVGDAGLTHFEGCKGLTHIKLQKTKVTAAKIEAFKNALPKCKIEWDGGVIEPRPSPGGDADRRAAEWVLSTGGMVHVNEHGRTVRAVADLPREPFRLVVAASINNAKVNDAGLAHLEGCKHLTELHLNQNRIGDAGLAHLKSFEDLTHLDLAYTQVGDAGLAHLGRCKRLKRANLSYTRVGDAGLGRLLETCKNLEGIWLDGTKVSDAGLAHFEGHKNMKSINLPKTQVTAAGIEKLKKALPNCEIRWDGIPAPKGK